MSDDWYYLHGEYQYGPATAQGLGRLIASGQLPSDTFVWRPGLLDWTRADAHPELAAFVPPPIPVAAGAQITTSLQRPDAPADIAPLPYTFQKSQSLLRRSLSPSGRFSRGDFAKVYLGAQGVSALLLLMSLMAAEADPSGVSVAGLVLALIVWTVASIPFVIVASVRRLHDTDTSGWALLVSLIPFGGLVLVIVMLFVRGKPAGATRWG